MANYLDTKVTGAKAYSNKAGIAILGILVLVAILIGYKKLPKNWLNKLKRKNKKR